MFIGYSLFDPVVVIGFTLYCLWLLSRDPVRLFACFPAALSLYFIIPSVTLITTWQTVPSLLFVRSIFGQSSGSRALIKPALQLLYASVVCSFFYVFLVSGDVSRALIRVVYYFTLLALFSFSFEFGAHPRALRSLINGLVLVGVIYGLYGIYQIIAVKAGLPVRGIVYGASPVSFVPLQDGFARVNSLANEPKRLGYVLFLASIASCYLPGMPHPKIKAFFCGLLALGVSLFTFSSSYYAAVLLFLVLVPIIHPKFLVPSLTFLFVSFLFLALFNLDSLVTTLSGLVDSRIDEIEIGIDGNVVYRQEFFALDFLSRDPLSSLFGVGIGQYFRVLSAKYGPGVGLAIDGSTLLPINSVPLESVFDLGLIFALFVYAWLFRLVIRLRLSGDDFLWLSLLFLIVQSFWIQTTLFLSVFAGIGLARLHRNAASSRQTRA